MKWRNHPTVNMGFIKVVCTLWRTCVFVRNVHLIMSDFFVDIRRKLSFVNLNDFSIKKMTKPVSSKCGIYKRFYVPSEGHVYPSGVYIIIIQVESFYRWHQKFLSVTPDVVWRLSISIMFSKQKGRSHPIVRNVWSFLWCGKMRSNLACGYNPCVDHLLEECWLWKKAEYVVSNTVHLQGK